MANSRLICVFCQKPIKRGSARGNRSYDEGLDVVTGVERAWHATCFRDSVASGGMHRQFPIDDPPTPFQALVLAAKQVIAQSRNLSPVEQQAFTQIVGQALNVQRRS